MYGNLQNSLLPAHNCVMIVTRWSYVYLYIFRAVTGRLTLTTAAGYNLNKLSGGSGRPCRHLPPDCC